MQNLILFADDWKRIDAIPNTQTTNRSFVHHAHLLKSMGVKNHMFFLALVDQRLKEVDPFAPSLSDEEVAMIVAECKTNPWYFFREVARAPGESGAKARMLEANRGNITLFWLFFNHITTLLIQIRQTGKSFNSDILATGLLQLWCDKTQINLLTLNEKVRRANIIRIKRIMDALPRYIDSRTAKDADNSETITVKEFENNYFTHLPRADAEAANTQGRGLTSPVFFGDEIPFQPNIHESLPAALAAGTTARNLAKSVGQPHGTVLTTTAGKKDTPSGAFVYNLMGSMAPWGEGFLDARNLEHLEEMVKASSRDKKLRVNITLNHTQLGKSDKWLQEAIDSALVSGEAADRDFFNRWTSGSATSPLDINTLEKIRNSERDHTYIETSAIESYATRWFIPEHEIKSRMENDPTIVVFDTSNASGGDDISMRVTSLTTGRPYATATINHTNIIPFSEWVCTWVTRWEKTTLLIEQRSTGTAVLDMLLHILPQKGIDPFKRIFNRIVNEPEKHKETWKMVQEPMGRRPSDFYTLNKQHFGFATSGGGITSRGNLYGMVLQSAAKTVGHLVYDRTTVDQITSLVIKNGRVNHQHGEHDDMVIGWCLTHWFMTSATNLRHYGINPAIILSNLKENGTVPAIDRLRQRQQQLLSARAKELYERLKDEQDDSLARMQEQELRLIYGRIEQREGDKVSVDDMINNLKEDRIRNRMSKMYDPGLERDRALRHEHERRQRVQRSAVHNFRPSVNSFNTNTRYF